jgi:hypothetical protein
MAFINPKLYQLSASVKLVTLATNHIAIVKYLKSRIIQKDAVKIVEIARQIQKLEPKTKVSLVCTQNICSKSVALLTKEGIEVKIENDRFWDKK